MKIALNLHDASTAQNTLWRGMGMVSGNNSSRLLMDYKALHPGKYNELLQLMFGKNGIGIQHLKIEMGSDINSSSGTEPCTMRHENEKPDVTRGAGFMLCADAKKINPNLTLDMLWWGEPLWIEKSSDVYKARYNWYKENLIQAYSVYKIKFDYVSATQNERGWDAVWIKYLSNHLKNEKDAPYDFSKIKIVAGEEVCTWNQAKMMLEDQELFNAVDVIGSHYTSWSDENTAKLQKMGKQIWFSEGSSPMGYSSNLAKYDGNGSGLNGLNGVLDVANRIITMYPGGKMTLCEFQPVVASYYDGVCYCHKQFITANTPWNGFYQLDPGFFMTLHFSQFCLPGWAVLEKASFADGKPAGDGHSIGDATYSYVSLCNPESKDWSTVITNTTESAIEYELELKDLKSEKIFLYETSSAKLENTLVKSEVKAENGKIKILIKPSSLVTISTLDKNPLKNLSEINKDILKLQNGSEVSELNPVMPLPYSDDFSYSDFKKDFLQNRGGAPLFTTDEGGAFEIENINGKNTLIQQINIEEKAKEWGYTPEPVTNFGDDRWFNYGAGICVKFDRKCRDEKNYAGIGIRYNLPCEGQNGYWIKISQSGIWEFFRNKTSVLNGTIADFDKTASYKIYIGAENNLISAKINDVLLFEKTTAELGISMQGGGRAAVFSNFYKNQFTDLQLIPLGKTPFITRYDNLDDCFEYVTDEKSRWTFGLMESFKCYKRTCAHGNKGAVLKLNFKGTGFNLCGYAKKGSSFSINIDGKNQNQITLENAVENREAICHVNGLCNTKHQVQIEVLQDEIAVDSVEVIK